MKVDELIIKYLYIVTIYDFDLTRVFLASEGGNPNLTANFLHGGLFVCIDDWVKNPRKSPGAKPPKNGFFKMAA